MILTAPPPFFLNGKKVFCLSCSYCTSGCVISDNLDFFLGLEHEQSHPGQMKTAKHYLKILNLGESDGTLGCYLAPGEGD